ncbi:hypothetical protein OG302_42605 [Streptomyces sp. NBC_01283]|uniref:hypothetical protein n=1 Tax=Streptomyces sp. NBC_01283 TaxID=2903812 RepID=UPI00352DBDA0|nr:hypothetical protein OG302_42605 [Streptomyces sp. NBC_01283]
MTIEYIAYIVLAAEVILMVWSRFGTERRHWKHHKKEGPAPDERDDQSLVPLVTYAVAALALALGVALKPVEWSLPTVGTFALCGILIPAFAANSIMVMATRGHTRTLAVWQQALGYAVAAVGGAASVGLV